MGANLGERIAALRKGKKLTQEQLAEKLGVSAQAVSKWENNISCPDILLLPELAHILGVTTDALLGRETPKASRVPEAERKPIEELLLKVDVTTELNDVIHVKAPMTLVKAGLAIGVSLPKITGMPELQEIDLEQLMKLVDSGLVGTLAEVETSTGVFVKVVVE